MKFARTIVVVLIILGILFSPIAPQKQTQAANADFTLKEYGLDLVWRSLARAFFQQAVNRLLNKIQTGSARLNGAAAFVQDWRNFQTNAEYRGENVFRAILANTQICGYLKDNVDAFFRVGARDRINLGGHNIRIDNLDPYTLRARCTMMAGFNPQTFTTDFNQGGGWEAYSQLLQPQNNFYSLYFDSLAELEAQRQLERNSDIIEAESGAGYTSLRAECEQPLNAQSRCTFLGRAVTPGDLVGKTAGLILDKNLEWLTNADELSEITGAIATYVGLYFDNLAAVNADTSAASTEDGDKLEYCSAKTPRTAIIEKYFTLFDPYKLARTSGGLKSLVGRKVATAPIIGGFISDKLDNNRGPCGEMDKDNPNPFNACVNQCLKALGTYPSDLPTAPLPSEIPFVAPTPAPTGGGGEPGPTGGPGCEPNGEGCIVNSIGNSCIAAQFRGSVNDAIGQFISNNPDVFQDPGSDSPIVKPGREGEYVSGVVGIINSSGLSAVQESGDEIAVKAGGGSFSENYDILTSSGQVRRFHAATCTPPSF